MNKAECLWPHFVFLLINCKRAEKHKKQNVQVEHDNVARQRSPLMVGEILIFSSEQLLSIPIENSITSTSGIKHQSK